LTQIAPILLICNETTRIKLVSNVAAGAGRRKYQRLAFHGLVQQGYPRMSACSRFKIVPLVSVVALFALSAQAEEQHNGIGQPPGKPVPKAAVQGPRAVQGHPSGPGVGPGAGAGPGPGRGHDARFARGALPSHNFGGHAYRGHLAWEGGRWRHEVHNGRDGYWWDVGGIWYYYPQPMDGPPTYVSDDYADDVPYADAAPAGAYAPQQGAYDPPPPPPPPDPAASAVGGAVVGGLLGGLLTGRASGAAAGAIVGGTTGAIVGATAASRPGYYFSQGNCYYRYPSGQYVQADPRACY
jgi:hypothetical protein